ncbi:MAG: hypothetical protein A2V70_11020 [Planctomycetes bacterium RBG_13_63_9]|nr:MAG: hypothetical protein A2V70_11020 [Planctomycetes bacterium RBG_13_63_9]
MDYSRLLPLLRRRKYLLLLVSLLLLAVLFPASPSPLLVPQVFDGLFCLVLLAGAFSLSQKKWPFLLALLLGSAACVATWSIHHSAKPDDVVQDSLVAGRYSVQLLFLGLVVWHVLRDVLCDDRVTFDNLCGAACGYVLLGTMWGLVYSMVHCFQNDAFAGELVNQLSANDVDNGVNVSSLMSYYSFVTLSTLGYGDITPMSPAARVLSWLEAISGQLYLAVLIARLVGLHIVHATATDRTCVKQ